MDALILLFAAVVGIAVFDLLAIAFGADSRDDFTDAHPYALSA